MGCVVGQEKNVKIDVRLVVSYVFALMFLLWSMGFASVGFLASDDLFYLRAAQSWIGNLSFVGESHWSLRQSIVLPTALSLYTFGYTPVGMLGPGLLYFLALVLGCSWYVFKYYGSGASLLFLVLASTAPGFISQPGTVNVDIAETFYIWLSVILFVQAGNHPRARTILFLSGLCVGLAFLSRATAVSLIIVYGIFFCLGSFHKRSSYLALGSGAALVYVIDMGYYFMQTGDLIYRLTVQRGTHITPSLAPQSADLPGTGNAFEGSFYEPFAALFASDEFGLVIIVGLVIWAYTKLSGSEKSMLATHIDVLFMVACAHFLVVVYVLDLRPLPRYFSLFYIPALLAISVGAIGLWHKGLKIRMIAAVLILGLVTSGLMLTDLSNKHPLRASEALLQELKSGHAAIGAKPIICRRAEGLAYLQGVTFERACVPFDEAKVVVFQPDSLGEGLQNFEELTNLQLTDFEVARVEHAPKTNIGLIIEAIGLNSLVPLPDRLFRASPTIYILKRR